MVARQAHNLKVRGSNPLPATNFKSVDLHYCESADFLFAIFEQATKFRKLWAQYLVELTPEIINHLKLVSNRVRVQDQFYIKEISAGVKKSRTKKQLVQSAKKTHPAGVTVCHMTR